MAHPLVTELLAAARAAHITQPDLTARAGIYARSVSYWKVARFGPSVGLLDAAAEVVGVAFDEAWGALKGYHHKIGDDWSRDDAEQDRKSLADAINNTWVEGMDCAALAERALRRLGYGTVRTVYSLEIAD